MICQCNRRDCKSESILLTRIEILKKKKTFISSSATSVCTTFIIEYCQMRYLYLVSQPRPQGARGGAPWDEKSDVNESNIIKRRKNKPPVSYTKKAEKAL